MKKLLVALLLSGSVTSYAAEPVSPVSFKGSIADVENYSPLDRVQVIVTSPDKSLKEVMETDAQGKFTFKDLPAGQYSLSLVRNGYETYTRNNIVVQAGKPLNMGFFLFRD
ncbi:MAG: carboxypeptidase regulatory-like domain-containing protein [Chitinophagaceae bacterium]|nr:MAG: carboxypeptidase regulatory-like domain-containing protein [Chitinophagaceae bacterium]